MKKFGLVRTLHNASRFRKVREAQEYKRQNTVYILLSQKSFGGQGRAGNLGIVHLVRYWIGTDQVTIHRYSEGWYIDHFHNGRYHKQRGRAPGYSHKWDNL